MRRHFILLISTSVLTLYLLIDRNTIRTTAGRSPRTIENNQRTVSAQKLINCNDRVLSSFYEQRGEFFILYNYVVAKKQFRCYEAVTYATHGDVTFLDNLVPIVERWDGPISVAIYAPGGDFKLTLDTIASLRNCENKLIKELVSFHLFFEGKYMPQGFERSLLDHSGIYVDDFNCSQTASYSTMKRNDLFRNQNNLFYPINIARNIARFAAQTNFVLSSDIELRPSPNISSKFIEMVPRNSKLFTDKQKRVFVLPVFEVTENSSVPENRTVLRDMIQKGKAIMFHEKLCKLCHRIPDYNEWLTANETSDLNIFTVVKRIKRYKWWEPFFVGTNEDPWYDERLSWEGQGSKMTQNFIQCLLDYDYAVLDNAFLVHRPGIKTAKEQIEKYILEVRKTNQLLREQIKNEIILMYGNRSGCVLNHR